MLGLGNIPMNKISLSLVAVGLQLVGERSSFAVVVMLPENYIRKNIVMLKVRTSHLRFSKRSLFHNCLRGGWP